MTSKEPTKPADKAGSQKVGTGMDGIERASTEKEPGWANGLRQLYDSVVEEDLPDSFKDLLSKLDAPKN